MHCRRCFLRLIAPLWWAGILIGMHGAACAGQIAELAVAIEQVAPRTIDELQPARMEQLVATAERFDATAGEVVFRDLHDATTSWAATRDLLAAHATVDAALERTLALRDDWRAIDSDKARRDAIRQFLQATSTLIDLSGRVRYLLRDAISAQKQRLRTSRSERLEVIETLIEHRSGIGAGVAAPLLAEAVDDWTKGKVLQLIAVAQEYDLLPQVVSLINNDNTSPGLLLLAGETVRYVGLPQDPHPQQPKDTPAPAITASQLLARMNTIDVQRLSERGQTRWRDLTAWLAVRKAKGVADNGYRFFGHTVREGDWFLMRNPSPYNMFTDLSPGLFTHVGVVTTDAGDDGIRRFVLVDMPERGETIPVTNVDAYVLRTLNYFFVRHHDAKAALAMGAAAREMIGNPSHFDLNFRTDRVAEYRGKPLAEATIHTYCAGFLLLCAQESELSREDFFPLIEYPAGGRTQVNLKTLGLSLGENFISPTAALFSPQIDIVGRRAPMYDPQRAVKEAVYDHFARQMNTGTLRQSPTAEQALREKLVRISSTTPWLRRAIAKANGVSEEMDLLSAARAAAVVETLDDIADASAAEFQSTREAFLAPADGDLRQRGYASEKSAQILAIRQRQRVLYDEWRARRITPPQLQRALVEQFSKLGRQRLDKRFFTTP